MMNNIFKKSGVIPYTFENGELWVMLVTPTNPIFGGNSPQICKGIIEDEYDVFGSLTAMRELKEETGIIVTDAMPMKSLDTYLLIQNFKLKYKLHMFCIELLQKEIHPFKETDGEVITNWYRIPTAMKIIRKCHKPILIDFISSLI